MFDRNKNKKDDQTNGRYQRPDNSLPALTRLGNATTDILRKMDFRSWVILILMFLILTAMMGLNAYLWAAFLPVWVAYLLSGFMEAGALAWKIADERDQNSDSQQQLTTFLVWFNVILAVVLMVMNLIRGAQHLASGQTFAGIVFLNGWDYTAFVMVGLSALSHVVGALLFRQWDDRIQHRRTIAKQHNKTAFDREFNDGVIKDLEGRLAEREFVLNKLAALREQYKHLPPADLAALLNEARNALEEQYQVDADQDGKIGDTPIEEVTAKAEVTVKPGTNHRDPAKTYSSEAEDFTKPSQKNS